MKNAQCLPYSKSLKENTATCVCRVSLGSSSRYQVQQKKLASVSSARLGEQEHDRSLAYALSISLATLQATPSAKHGGGAAKQHPDTSFVMENIFLLMRIKDFLNPLAAERKLQCKLTLNRKTV